MNTNNVPPPPNDSPRWVNDSQAKAEDNNWDNEPALKGQETKNKILWLRCYGWVMIAFLVFFAILFVGSLGAWSIHYLLPVDWHWLSEVQLSKIQSILFSGGIGGVISLIAQKQLSK